jgi:NADH-quinone oxidoreductase subunit J
MVQLLFWFFSGIAIVAAFLCVSRQSPVASALWLVLTMFSLSGIYVLLDAHFIAAIQVMVYAGAIMVLFLFVIMLLNLRDATSDLRGWPGRIVAGVIAAVLLVELWVVRSVLPDTALRLPAGEIDRLTRSQGAVQLVAEPLFHRYLVPFEATALLLLAATVGAVVLAKRRL